MKVLIVGSGGREHAIAWSVAKSPKVDKIYQEMPEFLNMQSAWISVRWNLRSLLILQNRILLTLRS